MIVRNKNTPIIGSVFRRFSLLRQVEYRNIISFSFCQPYIMTDNKSATYLLYYEVNFNNLFIRARYLLPRFKG